MSAGRTTKPKTVPMCCVTIGYHSYLMPLADGMKMVDIMQRAFECDRQFARGDSYVPKDQPNVEMAVVRPDQVKQPLSPAPRGTKALDYNPSATLP